MEKKDLKPAGVFHYFEEICQVPRPSKKEEKIIAYLKAFGEKHKLETKVDEAGNVLIKKPATPGMENRKTVVLQSHIDMVCEKNNDVKHDFLTDPIETEIDGEWLKAKGTTLGADNGIGVATELAILADDSIEHGPIECLFTVDEETGLTGAFALKEGFMNGDILLNLDSEDEGEIFIGCAGGGSNLGGLISPFVGQMLRGEADYRIIAVERNENGALLSVTTKGDNNELADGSQVSRSNIIAVYTGSKIPGLGKAMDFLSTRVGFGVCILLPLILFFIYQVVKFVMAFMSVKNTGKKVISAADEELIRQKAVEEYLKKQQQSGDKAEEAIKEEIKS